ncbi:uncharacterized protein LOC123633381 [Lemur catta]|uniref:uncharacterized protein LOC123633381 n=1 Tax=Lemur catta TaxID=9447 RepID=UPI001E269048|nr:uncharacterized protein LOC123633381 [Lemur catta]
MIDMRQRGRGLRKRLAAGLADLRRSEDGGVRRAAADWPLGRGRVGPREAECIWGPCEASREGRRRKDEQAVRRFLITGRTFSLTFRCFYIHLKNKMLNSGLGKYL